jgi:hypothetical protein
VIANTLIAEMGSSMLVRNAMMVVFLMEMVAHHSVKASVETEELMEENNVITDIPLTTKDFPMDVDLDVSLISVETELEILVKLVITEPQTLMLTEMLAEATVF